MYGYPWQLLHQTPGTVQDLPDLKMWFNNITEKLQYKDKEQLCNWSSQYVELAVLLLCHTFHTDNVQCVFLPDTLIPDQANDTINEEQMIHVKEGVTTLLCIVYKDEHFVVVKVHLEDQRVSVWDSANRR